jgi:hypothetical protein
MSSGWVYLRFNVDVLEKKRPVSARSRTQEYNVMVNSE